MIILHAISINCEVFFIIDFVVNFKGIKVNLPHCRALNEDVHVIVGYCSDAFDFNLSNSKISDVIFRHLIKYAKTKWQFWSRGLGDLNMFLIRLRLKFCTNKF